ncbi:thiol:disulfide interchange protein DsbD [Kushneria sinocarnis]|uniref:Thiol:disulfide interchange protein DsbD n=1 Tax=Kushneria sinocarnis TaxID=595502 RepID=A0A420WYW4_9GAMM|nr:protein-disulfide reductase DsbD [Kushneria sinocarnis]RKR06419.1 thiol:disulfide interchange protein DsbD [Kushneria sinocarnis]
MPRPVWVLLVLLGWMLLLPAMAEPTASSTFPDSTSSPASGRWFDGTSPNDLLPAERAFKSHVWRSNGQVHAGLQSAEGYYLYRHSLALHSATPGLLLGSLQMPAGEHRQDEWMGEVQVFHDRVTVSAPLSTVADVDPRLLDVRLEFQGCAESRLCYPPRQRQLAVSARQPPAGFTPPDTFNAAPSGERSTATSDPAASIPDPATGNGHYTDLLAQASLPWLLGLFLLAGLGLTFTPCVLPMLPIVTTLVVGQHARRSRALVLSLGYVAGMAATYALAGTLTGLFGAGLNLQARLQSPWVLGSVALLFVLLALWLTEWVRLPALPGNRLRQGLEALQHRLQQAGLGGAMLAGALSTLVVSPCISAPLAGAMVYISTTGNALQGGLALLALGLGMGIPLILVATLGAGWLPRSGPWLHSVRLAFALLLLALALWLIQRLLPPPVTVLLWGALALCIGVGLGALRLDTPAGWPRLRQALALVATVWGIACIIGAARGTSDPLQPLGATETSAPAGALHHASEPQFTTVTSPDELQAALQRAAERGRPALVDIYADWCISCRKMERDVFPAATLAERLDRFTLIRADVTASPGQAILRNRDLFGPPAVLFFSPNSDGAPTEQRALRSQGEIGIEELGRLLDSALANATSRHSLSERQ